MNHLISPDNEKILARFLIIHRIIDRKGWLKLDSPGLKESIESCYKLSTILNDEQFNLYQNLLLNFTKIEYDSYQKEFFRALDSMPRPKDVSHKFILLPIISPSDLASKKTKSGPSMIYPFKNSIWRTSSAFRDFDLKDYQSVESIRLDDHSDPDKTSIILIDDFIGTGDTFFEYLDAHIDVFSLIANSINLITVAITTEGLSRICARGINVYYSEISRKGIAENDSLNNKEESYRIMSSIEQNILISKKYRFGYKKSECLISLINTPNNTFPIFWCEKGISNRHWPAPFRRSR